MARIDADLLDRLEKSLGVSRNMVYKLIQRKVRDSHLPRPLAAIALAGEHGINIARYATADQLAEIRQAARNAAPAPVRVPEPREAAPARRRRGTRARRAPPARRRGNTVFVVHGRDLRLANALFAFLRALGLQPLEWVRAIRATGEPSPYVGTILETAFREAAAIVVLFTPDDEARLRRPFVKQNDPVYEKRLTPQARPNVLFEAGMAFGRNPESTVLVQVGDVRPFSDVGGRHVARIGNDATSRQELATKLANAGCNVDTSGTHWLTEGDFSIPRGGGRRPTRR